MSQFEFTAYYLSTLSSKGLHKAEALLSEDHESLAHLLAALQEALNTPDSTAAFARLDLFWARLAMHIRAEHLHLFPAILKSPHVATITSTDADKAIQQLRSDHDFFMHELSSAIKILREAHTTTGIELENQLAAVRGIVEAVRDRLEVHNELEEEIVYLLPERMLTPTEQVTLDQEVQAELENLPSRFTR